MRNLFVLLLSCAAGLGLLISTGQAHKTEPKEPEDPAKVFERLLKNVKQKDDVNARIQAIMDLADYGVKAEPALVDLLDALQTKNEDLRLNAAITLSKIGQPAVKPVAKLLDSDDKDTKFYAIWTLGWIGPEAKETVPTMIKLMADKNEHIRRKAAFALGRLAGDPDKTLSVLVEAFNDKSPEVRQAAGDALAKFGKDAVPALIELLKSANPEAQHQASMALGEWTPTRLGHHSRGEPRCCRRSTDSSVIADVWPISSGSRMHSRCTSPRANARGATTRYLSCTATD